jgi:hypothetical protein
MSTNMRAKMAVDAVEIYRNTTGTQSEKIKFHAVAKKDGYPSDGKDENNTYALYSPSAALEITITNPDLIGKINPGEFYYVDFTPVA